MNRPVVGDLADGWITEPPDTSLMVTCVGDVWVVADPVFTYNALSLADALQLAGLVLSWRAEQEHA